MNRSSAKKFFLALFILVCLALPVGAQSGAPKGISPCAAFSIATVDTTSSNVQLSQCGPTVILMNITTQEMFFNIGAPSTTAATTSNYSLPGNSFLTITVPTPSPGSPNGWYLAGITATGSTTLRIIQGLAQ